VSVASVIGTGLIGGSLAAALRASGWHVVGLDSDDTALAEALERRLIDAASASVEECVSGADLVLLAAPLSVIITLLPELDEAVAPEALILDTASVKRPVVDAMGVAGTGHRMVGGHPLAGSHLTGPGASDPDLFARRPFLLCPSQRTSAESLSRAQAVAVSLGGVPRAISAEEHDSALAVTSHLPQVLSSVLASLPAERTLAGPAYGEMTRLAASDAHLWGEILSYNRDNVALAIDAFRSSLDGFAQAVSSADSQKIEAALRAGQVRVTA
jgi:prephenate dehydrogenase